MSLICKIVLFASLLLAIFAGSSSAVSLPFRLVWERNSEADLAFYTVYHGTASRDYNHFGDVDKPNPYYIFDQSYFASKGITIGPGGLNLHIALTATDYSLNESGYSSELVVHIDPPPTTTTTSPITTTTPGTTTSPATTTVPAPATTKIFIDAEDGIISSPMEIAEDGAASLGEYLWVPNGNGTLTDPEGEGGYAEYVFTVPTTEDYVVWGRVISTTKDDDSFFASLDNGIYALWDTVLEATDVWMWDQISDRGFADPVIFHLEAGMHSLIIKQREDGTKLDKILITNDMDYIPSGMGEQTITTTTVIPGIQKEYCSPDPTLVLHGTIPEEGTMTVNIPDNLNSAISTSLVLTLFDPDIPGEGFIYTNDNAPLDLPIGPYDNLANTFDVPINSAWLVQGDNSIRFTHDDTWGYEVRELCVRVLFTNSPATTTTVPLPRPTTTTSVKPDTTPPTGRITINKGGATTACDLVTLYLSAEDDESGMGEGAQMMFSKHNKKQWSNPMPFEPEKQWTLSPGKGERTIYAKFCDAAGNWMDEPVSDSIVLSSSCTKPNKLSASSFESSSVFPSKWTENKIVDDNPNTGWLSPLKLFHSDESITIDLGETKVVNRVDISSHLFRQFDLFPHDFKVQASTDNKNWVNLFAVENYYPPTSRSESWTFEEIEARCIRMVITRSKRFLVFFYAAYIADITVYGCTEIEATSSELALSTSTDQADTSTIEQTLSLQVTDEKLRNNEIIHSAALWKGNIATAGTGLRNATFDPLDGVEHVDECNTSVIVSDNGSPFTSLSGIWDEADKLDSYGGTSLISRESGTHTWTPDLLNEGYYQLYMWWSSSMANCSSCPVEISCDGGLIDTLYVDQQQDGGKWNLLGPYDLEEGNACAVTILSGDSPLKTCADAVRFVYMEESLPEARINYIYPNPAAVEEEICFEGYGLPGDGMSIEGYIWTSNIDGVLSTSNSFCTSSLSEGTHRISFTVQDDEALCSVAAEAMVSVGVEAE